MNQITKRIAAFLLALMLSIGMLPGITLTAEATTQEISYQYGSASSYSDIIINWGSRGTTATYLSQNAESFYEDNDTSYAELSLLDGNATVSSVPESELYAALQELMESNHTTYTAYTETNNIYVFTDGQNGSATNLTCFYSGTSIGPAWDSGKTWNKEHTWPKSKCLTTNTDGRTDATDIMMLRPASSSINSSRGNSAYGESTGYYFPNEGSYDLRGDVARTMLYGYVRWGNTGKMWGSSGVIESVEILLKWIEADPVDTWELGRNDSVESITGTRNVFVDYPELAFLLFGEEVPSDMTTPSGEAAAASGYTVTATSSNDSWGTVTVSGNTIVAAPAEGYYTSGYSILSGEATVTQNGNVFTVATASDCAVEIIFAAKTPATVTIRQDGTTVTTLNTYVGDSVTLPAPTGDAPEGYTFVGWVEGTVEETTDLPEVVYSAGSSYTAQGDAILCALYSRIDEESTDSGSVYNLYSDELTEGDYLIVYNGYAMRAAVSGTRLAYTAITSENDTVTSPAADLIWHIAPAGDSYWTFYNDSTAKYAGGTGGKSKATLLTSVTDFAKWSVSGTGTYDFSNLGNKNKNVNYSLRLNVGYGFACYASGFEAGVSLYKCASGTVYYTTNVTEKVNPFTDVDEEKYYFQPIMWAVENGVTAGRTETYFGVGETCTREQIVTFLWRAMGEPEPTTTVSPFTDVQNSNSYYYDAVLWAVENGVTAGRTDTYFGVGEDCTREQIVTFLWRAMSKPEPSSTVSTFPDVQNSNAYYYKAVLWAVEEGITSGRADGTFGVSIACTREQAVTFLYNALTN